MEKESLIPSVRVDSLPFGYPAACRRRGGFVTHDRVAGAEGFPRSVRSVDEMFVPHRSDRTRTPIKESSNTKPPQPPTSSECRTRLLSLSYAVRQSSSLARIAAHCANFPANKRNCGRISIGKMKGSGGERVSLSSLIIASVSLDNLPSPSNQNLPTMRLIDSTFVSFTFSCQFDWVASQLLVLLLVKVVFPVGTRAALEMMERSRRWLENTLESS